MKLYFAKALDLSGRGLFTPYLCSRDIQIGDEVYEPSLEFEGTLLTVDEPPASVVNNLPPVSFILITHALKVGAYKLIGEISPKAKWVKDGDEFDEEDIIRTYSERSYDYESDQSDWYTYQVKGTDPDPECTDSWHFNPIKLKGPCGHFH